MSSTAIVTMIVILSIVWGGFVLALRSAVRKESEKADAETSA
jgi:hypothetical protein